MSLKNIQFIVMFFPLFERYLGDDNIFVGLQCDLGGQFVQTMNQPESC